MKKDKHLRKKSKTIGEGNGNFQMLWKSKVHSKKMKKIKLLKREGKEEKEKNKKWLNSMKNRIKMSKES